MHGAVPPPIRLHGVMPVTPRHKSDFITEFQATNDDKAVSLIAASQHNKNQNPYPFNSKADTRNWVQKCYKGRVACYARSAPNPEQLVKRMPPYRCTNEWHLMDGGRHHSICSSVITGGSCRGHGVGIIYIRRDTTKKRRIHNTQDFFTSLSTSLHAMCKRNDRDLNQARVWQ